MESLLDLLFHFDRHLAEFIVQYGVWVYAILFLIVFAATGRRDHADAGAD